MLELQIPGGTLWDEAKEEFLNVKPLTLRLEHSLVSISKWESKWKKPFLSEERHPAEEALDYVRCMTLTQNVDPAAYYMITDAQMAKINEYIQDPMTATWFGKSKKKQTKRGRRVITAELIYYWMFSLNIPLDCQKWHLNRLLTLIKVFEEESDQQELSQRELAARNSALNMARRAKLHSRG